MYAEITIYNDDGIIKNTKPYVIPSNNIHERAQLEGNYEIVDHEFKFVWTERIPKDPKEIDFLEREHEAFEKGRKVGREEVLCGR